MKRSLEEIKAGKNFYRNLLRRTIRVLIFSGLVALVLVGFIFYGIVNYPEPDLYATNSESFIVPLTALDTPNKSSQYLLKPQPPKEAKKELKVK